MNLRNYIEWSAGKLIPENVSLAEFMADLAFIIEGDDKSTQRLAKLINSILKDYRKYEEEDLWAGLNKGNIVSQILTYAVLNERGIEINGTVDVEVDS